MTPLEKKANDFKKAVHGKRNAKHNCMFFCEVSSSAELCQIKAKRGRDVLSTQTIPWRHFADVKDISKLGMQTLTAMGNLLAFGNI